MAHPIHQANDRSPYGDLTREEFYKKHQILHQESFMSNKKNKKIFTQFWRPDSTSQPKGIVAMVHGYSSESSWLNELTAVSIAKEGFLVCALDLQGHGRSDGRGDFHPDMFEARACMGWLDIKQCYVWHFSKISSLLGPLEKLLPLAALFAPTWKVVASKPVSSRSYKEEWKRRLVASNPNRRSSRKPSAATALVFFRVSDYIRRHCYDLKVPFLMVHGEDDFVCDFRSASFVHESASSKDKTLKIFPGMWHMWIGEPEDNVELVFGTILSWLEDHAATAKKTKTVTSY
ncbi:PHOSPHOLIPASE-RELATED [Salix purpurea]|uniref:PHOSPHOLIPASE-RELATED n=1 Tax=Salix purpurea TaxID=77065 RepID=A0A9Q0WPT4_SALPP|nr:PHOSPHOLIPASE-RELATED [Salix purpurea]